MATLLDIRAAVDGIDSGTIAERMGVSRRTVQRWLDNGVDVMLADTIAVKVIGEHPIYVWGSDWANADDLDD